MLIVHVNVHVKQNRIDDFKMATIRNASESVREPGIARFDVIQREDNPSQFVLVEVYRDSDATVRHKETTHYAEWRDAVAPMMAEPRSSVKYYGVYPDDDGWAFR